MNRAIYHGTIFTPEEAVEFGLEVLNCLVCNCYVVVKAGENKKWHFCHKRQNPNYNTCPDCVCRKNKKLAKELKKNIIL